MTPNATRHIETPTRSKLLMMGDSILHAWNKHERLIKGVQKHSKSGATVEDLIDDISFYDLKAFSTFIIYVGGNDCSQSTSEDVFLKKI